MESESLQKFEHAIEDSIELLNHFDNLNKNPPPPPEAEVLKRASLVMALAAYYDWLDTRKTSRPLYVILPVLLITHRGPTSRVSVRPRPRPPHAARRSPRGPRRRPC